MSLVFINLLLSEIMAVEALLERSHIAATVCLIVSHRPRLFARKTGI